MVVAKDRLAVVGALRPVRSPTGRITVSHGGRRSRLASGDGAVLTRADLERIFIDLRALISGTDQLDPNRSFAVDIAVAITHAIERERGGQ